jgi:hypothetical protein
MTCDTENAEKEKKYLHLETVIGPLGKPRWQTLKKLYLDHPKRKSLPKNVYGVMDRFIANEFELYREANIPLEAKDSELRQKYQKIMGRMTVTYDGKEQTLQQVARHLEENDRARRQEVWELVGKRRLQDCEALEDLYDEMVKLRTRIGRNAGFKDYRDYTFQARGRFDYTPQHCFDFHRANEAAVVPALRRRHDRRRKLLGLDVLRPWDLAVDPEGRSPLRPFKSMKQLMDGCGRIFKKVHPDFAKMFDYIRKKNYLDLDSRKGKAPGRLPDRCSTSSASRSSSRTPRASTATSRRCSTRAAIRSTRSSAATSSRASTATIRRSSPRSRRWAWNSSASRTSRSSTRRRTPTARGPTTSRAAVHLRVGRHDRRLPALGLHRSRPFAGRPEERRGSTSGSGWAGRRTGPATRTRRRTTGTASSPVHGPFLLHRVRNCADRRAAGLAQREEEPEERDREVPRGRVARVDAAAAGALQGVGPQVRFQREDDRARW